MVDIVEEDAFDIRGCVGVSAGGVGLRDVEEVALMNVHGLG